MMADPLAKFSGSCFGKGPVFDSMWKRSGETEDVPGMIGMYPGAQLRDQSAAGDPAAPGSP